MADEGVYDNDGDRIPIQDYGWLVSLDDAKQWLKSNNTSVNPDALEAEIADIIASADADIIPSAEKDEVGTDTSPSGDDCDKVRAALFDPLPVEALAKMFEAAGKWKGWADKAKANGLIAARQGSALFNPYKAGVWFVLKGAEGWDLARLHRTLTNNLPARSLDKKHLLTGDIE